MTRWLWVVCGLLIVACSADRKPGELFGPSFEGTLVVDGLLLVDHPLPEVFVHQTMALGKPYTREAAAVLGAEVEIRQGDQVFPYRADPDSLGRYLPPEAPPLVTPHTEYHLTVRSEGREAHATTRTPARYRIREVVLLDERTLEVTRRLRMFADGADSVFTAPENQITYLDGLLEAHVDPVDVPGYQVGIFSLDLDSDFVVHVDFWEEEDYENLERQIGSPPLEGKDGVLRMPWFMIYFAGRHLIKIYALDKNWFDFARSSPEWGGGEEGGTAGGISERPLFNVEGGIGLFGSASVDSLGFVILPKEKSEQGIRRKA